MRKFLRFVAAFLLMSVFLPPALLAQERTIKGTVLSADTKAPMMGVNVTVKNTLTATQTDAAGNFQIAARTGQTLQFSYVGFGLQEVTVGEGSTLSVSLSQLQETLNDVVVVGYATQKRANLTGAVSTVNVTKTLGSRGISDVGRGLQGAVPGLTITTPSGDIGTNPTIRLRGLSGSINGGGATPLILVDNVELPDLRMINPDDIESISVLKDAASTSIYGSRAAWGVILITTKSGKKGGDKNKISYNNNFAWSQPTTMPEVAPAAEGAEMALKAYQRITPNRQDFSALGMYVDQASIAKMKEWVNLYGNQDLGLEMVKGRDFDILNGGRLYFYRTWDPMEIYLRDWAPQQTHNLTLSGSTPKTGYTLGLGYLGQKGVLKVNPDEFERFNVNLGVTSSITPWLDAHAKVLLSRAKRTRPYYFSSETYDPWYYLTRWQGYYPYGTYEGKPFRSALTEVQQAKMTPIITSYARVQVGGTFKLTKGLTFDLDYTYSSNNEHEHQTGGSVSAYNFWGGSLTYEKYTSATYDRAIYISDWSDQNVVKAYATYNKQLGDDHDFKVIAGTDVELRQFWSQTSEKRSLLNPDMGEPRLATGDQFVNSSRSHWATNGYFGRINYSFKDKLLFEANARMDGSSFFPPKDQWGFFPSVSAGYIVTQEDFMDGVKPVLSFLKLRGSWGSVGNPNVGGYRFLKTMSSSNSGWLVGANNMLTVSTPGLVSPTLTWETVSTLDFGFDARLFNNKLGISFDWFNRTTSDIITAGLTVPSTLGVGAPAVNFGELQTRGWEISVDWNHQFDNGINFNATAVLSDFKEEITKFSNSTKLISSAYYEGKHLGDIWGYETDRFFTKDDFESDANGNLLTDANGHWIPKAGVPTQQRWEASWFFYGPGDVKYKDLNGDGKIDIGTNSVDDPGDQKIIGNSRPRYQYGVRLGAEWKGFDLNVFIQGVGKREMWANGPVVIPGYRPGEGWYAHQLDYWTEENPNAFYPRPTDQGQSNATRNFLPQTKYLLNMAYTRVKTLSVGYSLPAKLIKRAKLQHARIYFNGENLFTIDKLKEPIDPEIDYTTPGLNDPNTFGRVYPYRKSVSVGIQITL